MSKKKRFNQQSHRTIVGQKLKCAPTKHYDTKTVEPTENQDNTSQELELPTKANIQTSTEEIQHSSKPKQVLLHEFKSDKLLCNQSIQLAIAYDFVQALDIPPPPAWTGHNGTIANISRTLNILKVFYGLILNALQKLWVNIKCSSKCCSLL